MNGRHMGISSPSWHWPSSSFSGVVTLVGVTSSDAASAASRQHTANTTNKPAIIQSSRTLLSATVAGLFLFARWAILSVDWSASRRVLSIVFDRVSLTSARRGKSQEMSRTHTHTLQTRERAGPSRRKNKNVFSRVCSSCFPFFVVSTNQRAHTQRNLQQNTNTRRRGSAGRRNVQTASAELSRLLFHCCIEEMHISVTAIILNESSFKHSFQFHPFMNDFLFFFPFGVAITWR